MEKKVLIAALFLILIGILFRTMWHIGPNIEFLTTASLLAAYHLPKRWAILVPVAAIVISDFFIGNTSIILFTWSGYMGIGILAIISRIWKEKIELVSGVGFVSIAAFWFYLWTNFGVWFLDAFGMYEKSMKGLIDSYMAGVPFLRMNLLGSLMFLSASIGIVRVYSLFIHSKSLKKIHPGQFRPV